MIMGKHRSPLKPLAPTHSTNTLLTPAETTSVLATKPSGELGQQIINYFMYALLIGLVATWLLPRPTVQIKPFTLPSYQRPGNLVKRAIATVIDLLPFNILAAAITASGMEQLTDDQTMDRLRELLTSNQPIPAHMAIAVVIGLGSYLIYCFAMETAFGATIGKMIMSLRVTGDEGKRPRARQILLRNLTKMFELSPPLMVVWVLFPILKQTRQRLGDMVARTTVIDAKTANPPPPLPTSIQPPDDGTDL